MPFRWSYHKVCMKWIDNCQLAAGCQFDFYQELWIGNCQLSASCQFERATIRNIWNELATVNWQLAANSISIKNFELATVNCQPAANSISIKNFEMNWQLSTGSWLPIRWIKNKKSYIRDEMKWIGNCQPAGSWLPTGIANSISIKNFELATVNCQPAANSMNLS